MRAQVVMPTHALLAMIAIHHRRQHTRVPGLTSVMYSPTLDHLAGDVAAQNVREGHAREPAAGPQVQVIQRAGADPDQHLIFA